jgi:DNA polymerase III epsilon subunit-like protein
MQLTNRIVFVDVETSGVSSKKHEIIQLAAVRVNPTFSGYRTFEVKLQFDHAKADPQALAMNSYDAAVWEKEAVSPREAATQFARFLEESADLTKTSARTGREYKVAQLAAHNASFDSAFIFDLFKSLDIYLPANWHFIDTIQLALIHSNLTGHQPASFSLGKLCEFYDIPLEDAHDALGDVVATARLARRLFADLSA